jgi:mono/diheme cytochrome c family protein
MRVAIFASLFGLSGLAASGSARGEDRVDFLKQIQPILQKNCASCHGAAKQKAGLRLESGGQLLKGSIDGPVVVAKKPNESKLIHALRGTNDLEQMPPGKPLAESDVTLIAKWIEQGAAVPAESERKERHWAFTPPTKLRPPVVGTPFDNPIDAFLEAERRKRGLSSAPLADKETLVRRITLDLTGLPPPGAERQAFLTDDSPDAYERLVDRLLASPRYGERWGRHFLDVWRYSDWYGWQNELRYSQKNIWNWRDWVVESLNDGKPYDRMIQEMLAADEIDPLDRETLRATGFLARNYYKFSRNVWLDETVEHTGKAFCGVTLNCAKCHDHMYDPISQEEYFRFRAIFEPHNVRLDAPPDGDPEKTGLPRVYDADLAAQTFLFERGDDKRPKKDRPLAPGAPKELTPVSLTVAAVPLAPDVAHPTLRPEFAKARLAAARQGYEKAKAAGEAPLKAALLNLLAVQAALDADRARYAKPQAADHKERVRHAVALHLEAKIAAAEADVAAAEKDLAVNEKAAKKDAKAIDAAKKKIAAAKTALEQARQAVAKPPADYPPLAPSYPEQSTGRRLALARWITAKENPLTARVFVNHVWLRHFGQPIVPTVFEFGKNGRPPSHPALLDWLAAEFVESGWNVKRLHRLILTSRAYRMSSTLPGPQGESARKRDPDNVYLWRMNPRPLEAEAVRDAILATAGMLDGAMGGPEIVDDEHGVGRRRAIYFRHAPEKTSVFLSTMDGPSPTECYRRPTTVVPQQAMALANSKLTAVAAENVAGDLKHSKDAVGEAFHRLLGRSPTDGERKASQEFLKRQPPAAFVEALFSHVDFTTIR